MVEYSNYSYLQFIETVRWDKNQNTKNLILDVKLFSFYGHRVGETPITPQGLLTLLYRFPHRTVKLTWCVNTYDRYNNLECAWEPYEKNLKQGSYFGIITENFRSPSFRTANNTHLSLLKCFKMQFLNITRILSFAEKNTRLLGQNAIFYYRSNSTVLEREFLTKFVILH